MKSSRDEETLLVSPLILFTAVIILTHQVTAHATASSNATGEVLAMHDSSQYLTATTTPASAVVEVITLNSTHHAKNETLKAQEQNQFPANFGGPFSPGQAPLPPHLIAALQRRQQLLQAQNGGRPVNALQLLQGFLPGGVGRNIWSSLSPLQRQQLQQQILRNQDLQRQLAQRGGGQGLNLNQVNNQQQNGNQNGASDDSNDGGGGGGGGGGEEDGQGGQEGQEEPQQNPQDDPDLKQLQGLQGGNNDGFPGDGGSIFEGLFPPGILSQQDIKDIEKGIAEQRQKEEEEKRAKEEEEAREAAAEEENNNAGNGEADQNTQNNNNNNHNANDQHQGHGHHQQNVPSQQPVPVNGYPAPINPSYPSQSPAPNLINQNLPPQVNNQLYPIQANYPPSSAGGYQNPSPGAVPNFAQIPVHPGGQINQHQQHQQPPPQQGNYLPGVQQIPGGLYPNTPSVNNVSPVNNLPPTQVHQQGPFSPSYPGTGQGPLSPPLSPVNHQVTPQLQPQQVAGYTPGTVGGYPAVNSPHHRQQPQPQAQQPPQLNQYQPPQSQAPLGQVNPLSQLAPQLNPALLNQLNPALLQQYGQQLRNGGLNALAPGGPLGQLNPAQLNQLNQLARGFTQGNGGAGQSNASPPSPLSPFNGLAAFTPNGGRGISPGQGSPGQPASIGSLLRGAGRALGIPGFAAGSNTLSPRGTPTESPYTTSTPNYGAIRDNLAARQPQEYDRPRGSYDRDDDRRAPYPNRGGEYDRSSVDYEDNRNGNGGPRSPYREKYERTRGGDRPAEKFSSYGKMKDEVRRDRDYGNDYRAGVEYNPNDINDNDHGNYNRDIPSRPRQPSYQEDYDRGRGDQGRRTFRDQTGNLMPNRQYSPYNRDRDDYEREKGRYDDDVDLHRNRANPFLAG